MMLSKMATRIVVLPFSTNTHLLSRIYYLDLL